MILSGSEYMNGWSHSRTDMLDNLPCIIWATVIDQVCLLFACGHLRWKKPVSTSLFLAPEVELTHWASHLLQAREKHTAVTMPQLRCSNSLSCWSWTACLSCWLKQDNWGHKSGVSSVQCKSIGNGFKLNRHKSLLVQNKSGYPTLA